MGFAEKRLKLADLPSFRAEHFPYSGPYPWLDQPDANERIDARLARGELTASQAEQCRKWTADGYLILPRLIEPEILDRVWDSYERAIASGKIKLSPDPAGEGDPHPGRFLNPHKRAGAFCEILKHGGLLGAIRMLMQREPKVCKPSLRTKDRNSPSTPIRST